ncbi:hypothetical protein [Microbacterium sp. Se5.02b]|uniref:hypothetical protein n=1 Tax=Microbacterium sp. Se5.02b TaxID=2864103 RepID=UPI00215D9F97|nr:hypothetical protein [Microbacterium sp. Se5.02b]
MRTCSGPLAREGGRDLAPALRVAEKPLPSSWRHGSRWLAPRKGHHGKALPPDGHRLRRTREELRARLALVGRSPVDGLERDAPRRRRCRPWAGRAVRSATSGVKRPVCATRRTGERSRSTYTAAPVADGYAPPAPGTSRNAQTATDVDRAAIARYDYLLRTADPQRVEQIHREAFARLTPEQRALVEARMRQEFEPGERPRSSSPDDLARAAGRAEAMKPGRMRGLLSRARGAGAGGAAVAAGGAAVGMLGVVAGEQSSAASQDLCWSRRRTSASTSARWRRASTSSRWPPASMSSRSRAGPGI